ncbi:MAG: hypothetical protein CHACPFDD_00692 [Phycisphaerae bacterium]|nr:hypothetical protein [Phycisphaerae bacterium]
MIPTVLSLWTAALILAAIVMPPPKVAWAFWRFAIILVMAACACMLLFALYQPTGGAGLRSWAIGGSGLALLAGATWLALLLRTGGAPTGGVAWRAAALPALGGALCGAWALAAENRLMAPTDVVAGAALLSAALVVGFATMAAALGHAYLTAKAMPIDPLRRVVAGYGLFAIAQAAASAGVVLRFWTRWADGYAGAFTIAIVLMYVMIGVVASLVFAFFGWQAVGVRNTQSTTGIMYFAMVMNFVGLLSLCFVLVGG